MTLDLWLAFVATAALVLVLPGPTILAVISQALAHGRRATLPMILGVACGDAVALAASLLGLGALLATSAFWFGVVKWVGGLYLLWLGIRMLRAGTGRAGGQGEGAALPMAEVGAFRLFFEIFSVTALNPKGIVFFVAFLPQFVRPDQPAAPQLTLLAATFVALAIVNVTLYALFAGRARRLMTRPALRRGFDLAGGSLLTAAGIWALMARRPSV